LTMMAKSNMEKSELVFIPGLSVKKSENPQTPTIKLQMFVKSKEFFTFAKEHTNERGWLNIDIRWSEAKRVHYATLNTYEGNGQKVQGDDWDKVNAYREENNKRNAPANIDPAVEMSDEIDASEIPF